MMLLESPSQAAPISKWIEWAERLKTFNPHDRTVVEEKKRAQRVIALLNQPKEVADETIPF